MALFEVLSDGGWSGELRIIAHRTASILDLVLPLILFDDPSSMAVAGFSVPCQVSGANTHVAVRATYHFLGIPHPLSCGRLVGRYGLITHIAAAPFVLKLLHLINLLALV